MTNIPQYTIDYSNVIYQTTIWGVTDSGDNIPIINGPLNVKFHTFYE